MRSDGRKNDQIRHAKITRNYIKHADIEPSARKQISQKSMQDRLAFETGQEWLAGEDACVGFW